MSEHLVVKLVITGGEKQWREITDAVKQVFKQLVKKLNPRCNSSDRNVFQRQFYFVTIFLRFLKNYKVKFL